MRRSREGRPGGRRGGGFGHGRGEGGYQKYNPISNIAKGLVWECLLQRRPGLSRSGLSRDCQGRLRNKKVCQPASTFSHTEVEQVNMHASCGVGVDTDCIFFTGRQSRPSRDCQAVHIKIPPGPSTGISAVACRGRTIEHIPSIIMWKYYLLDRLDGLLVCSINRRLLPSSAIFLAYRGRTIEHAPSCSVGVLISSVKREAVQIKRRSRSREQKKEKRRSKTCQPASPSSTI